MEGVVATGNLEEIVCEIELAIELAVVVVLLVCESGDPLTIPPKLERTEEVFCFSWSAAVFSSASPIFISGMGER